MNLDLSPEQAQKVMGRLTAWLDDLRQRGVLKSGQPLMDEGRMVRKGRILADGPFPEAKEAVGGYLLLQADTLDEAAAIAQQCPCLEHGVCIEVRPVAEECPKFQRARELLARSAN